MIKQFLRHLLFTLSVLFVFLPNMSLAQTDASITLTPQYPAPHSQVTLTLTSYSFDVNQSLITWTSGKNQLQKGVGQKKLVIQTGGVGEQMPIHVVAVSGNGDSVGLDVVIMPESVDLLYESDESYVPPFYDGLALPGEEAYVKFVAMPDMSDGGGIVPPSSISYFWYVDDTFIDSASGIGKQSARLKLDTFNTSTDIKVVAHTPRGVVAEKTITIYPHDVLPLLYTYDDTLGANYSSLITRRFESTGNFTLLLEPFFLSTGGALGDAASYLWLLDGLPVTPIGGKLLSLHPKENSYGSRKLSISVSSSGRRLQKGAVDVDLIFDTRK